MCNNSEPEQVGFRDSVINIDLKRWPRDLIKKLGLTEEQCGNIYKQKIQKTYDLIIKYNMQNRVYWNSWGNDHQTLRDDTQYSQISRSFEASTVFKVLAMWLIGLLPFQPIYDQNYNMLVMTDEKYE